MTVWPLDVIDGALVMTMKTGKVNAMGMQYWKDLNETLDHIESERKYDKLPLVITGQGGFFTPGLDLKEVSSMKSPEETLSFVRMIGKSFERVFLLPRRTVAAVNGHAIAGGYVIALCCDARIMSKGNGRVGLTEVLVGLSYPTRVMEICRTRLPTSLLLEVTTVGKLYTADEAYELNLMEELVPPELLLKHAIKRAVAVPPGSYEAYINTKKQTLAPAVERIASIPEDKSINDGDWMSVKSSWSEGGRRQLQAIVSKL
eukprot:TRINITY_DN353_c0_g1_i2.p1 TRINITY_DN353_c0_g1~~TRINITY_DN353_c0_g1_i2.p1  ORF type:complete len:259 (+),score=36.45 TRINITY_DN353_c0_g1_i2:303-1079(+)